jgi:hypothetical protein
MKSLLLASIALFILSCNEPTSKNNLQGGDKVKEDSLKSTLLGMWGDLHSPSFDIRKDSIHFFESPGTYPYKISKGNLIILFSETTDELRNIHVIKDTLYFINEQGLKIKGFRLKK